MPIACGWLWCRMGVALGSLWGRLRVALGWPLVAYCLPTKWLWGGFGMASSGLHCSALLRGGTPQERAFLARFRLCAQESAPRRGFPSCSRQVHFRRHFKAKLMHNRLGIAIDMDRASTTARKVTEMQIGRAHV